MEKTISDRFLDSLYLFSESGFPEDVIAQTKYSLADYVSCTMIGSFFLKKNSERFLHQSMNNSGVCSIIGFNGKYDVYTAAFLNGVHAHYIELDDGHRFGMIHVGAVINSALLAAAQDRKLSSIDLIRGIITGYEATIRLACAIQPSHKLIGFHATGTCGQIGAAIGIASALKFDRKLWNGVLSAAVSSAAGLLEMSDDGSQLKPYNVGHAAAAAVMAAYYGASGLNGPSDILAGDRGFFKAEAKDIDESRLYESICAIKTVYRKPYAACRHAHPSIEAALKICKEHKINADDVEEVVIETYGLALKGHDHKDIQNSDSAKMSIPYAVASAIVFRAVNFEQFDKESYENDDIRKLLKKITIKENKELSSWVPEKRAAIVSIATKNETYVQQVDYPLGEPENPLSKKDLEEKYYSLLKASGCRQDFSKDLLESIYNIDNDLKSFLEKL